MQKITHTKGYSLVEVLVAISILLIALIGPITIAAKGLQSAYYAKEQTTALFLAQEGVEIIIAIKNDSVIRAINSANLGEGWHWATVTNKLVNLGCFSSTGCNTDGVGSPSLSSRNFRDCSTANSCQLFFDESYLSSPYRIADNAAGADQSKFTRVINLERIDGGESVRITATVSWSSGLFGALTKPVSVSTIVSNIYE